MAIEFHGEPGGVDVTVGGIEIPGVFRAEETGEGITEKYKSEVEERSGGADSAEEPPAARIQIEAYVRDETFEELNELRSTREPFEVGVGPFAFEQMGIVDIDLSVDAEETNSKHLRLQLQEYREQIVQQRSMSDQGGDGSGTGSTGGLDAEGPAAAWTDSNGDGRDDETQEPIPEMQNMPVASGQEVVENVGSGDGFGRVNFNLSSGGRAQINTTGQNWAVQDIGFTGATGTAGSGNWTNMNLTETGGQSLVRNIYMADGSPMYNGRRGATGMWVDNDSTGDIVFEFVNVQGFSDNGIYASAPKSSSTIAIRYCYARNNGISQYRLANGHVSDSVAVIDGGNGTHGGRGVWAWAPGPVEVNNSHIVCRPANSLVSGANNDPGGTINAHNSGIAGNTTHRGAGINISGEITPDPNAYDDRIPGSGTDAAAGMSTPGGGGE